MHQRRSWIERLFLELQRRHVIRVVGIYVVSFWAILQVADIVLPALMAPDWTMTLLVVLGSAGLPLAAVLAWIYDLTSEGIQRTADLAESAPVMRMATSRWVDYVVIGALCLILAFVLMRPGEPDGPIDRTVAVMPFVDLSPEQDSRYFGDGIAEAIMDRLARIPEIRISARTSAFSYRGTDLDARRVAEELGVGSLLEGSISKSGDRVRVNARLIDGRSGTQVWSERYEGRLGEIFEVQDQISNSIAQLMQVQFNDVADPALSTPSEAAYDEYLRGRDSLRKKGSVAQLDRAIGFFRQALELDPDFAPAAAGLCRAMWERYELNRDPDAATVAMEQCRETEAKYAEFAETRIAIGSLLLGTGKPEEAAESFRTALAREPNNAEAHSGLGLALRDSGQLDAAAAETVKAIDMDPAYWRYRWEYGVLNIIAGELEPAIEALKAAIRLSPSTPEPYSSLGGAYFLSGQFLLAADAFERSIEQQPNPVAYSNAGTNYFFAGEFARAEAMFQRAAELNPDDFRYTGFLAWAIRAQPGREPDAEVHHRKTISTASERLAINVNDDEARAALAVHLAALGHEAAANGALASLAAYEQLNANALVMTAFAHYFLGQTEKSSKTFQLAIDNGLPAFLLQNDPRLKDAWSNSHFTALIEPRLSAHATTEGVQP